MGKTDLDDHGQPLNKRFNARRMAERAIDEMLGICKGILADGVVVPMEVEYLKDWLWSNKETAGMWPANVLAERLRRIFADGHVDSEEREDLQELLESVTGLRDETTIGERKSTQLPLDDPMPDLDFEGRLFCFTGKFAYGTRNDCQYAVVQLGGQCQSNPTKKTDYLVIGIFGSNEWIHTTHGRKIEAVIQNRHKGALTAIIDEDHWEKIYLEGIDTPEIRGKCEARKRLAIEAWDFLNGLMNDPAACGGVITLSVSNYFRTPTNHRIPLPTHYMGARAAPCPRRADKMGHSRPGAGRSHGAAVQ